VRRAGRRQTVAATLALAVLILLTVFAGALRSVPGSASLAHRTGAVGQGHQHRPQALALRRSDQTLQQHRRGVPAVAATTTAAPVVLSAADPAGGRQLPVPSTHSPPRSRAPPAG